MSTMAEFLTAFYEAQKALAQIAPHLDTLWSLGHEPSRGESVRRSNLVVDVGSVGDAKTRDALRQLEGACLGVKRHADYLWGSLQIGWRDDELRGTSLSDSEFARLLARKRERGGEARLVPQPLPPEKGHDK